MTEVIVTPLERCTKCGIEYPASVDYFYLFGKGFAMPCKACFSQLAQVSDATECANARLLERDTYDKFRVSHLNSHARVYGLPATLTVTEYRQMMDYWHNCCAYCGRQRDFWDVIVVEHFIAISDPRPDNPGTSASNLVPACRLCNTRKRDYLALDWLERKFGKHKAAQIIQRIEAYFQTVGAQSNG